MSTDAQVPNFEWHDLTAAELYAFRESGGAVFVGMWRNLTPGSAPAAFAVAVASWNNGKPFYVSGLDLSAYRIRQIVDQDGMPVGTKIAAAQPAAAQPSAQAEEVAVNEGEDHRSTEGGGQADAGNPSADGEGSG